MEEKTQNPFRQKCRLCGAEMKFYPGCCGNLPLWRCERCGQIAKWKEPQEEQDKYLKLK